MQVLQLPESGPGLGPDPLHQLLGLYLGDFAPRRMTKADAIYRLLGSPCFHIKLPLTSEPHNEPLRSIIHRMRLVVLLRILHRNFPVTSLRGAARTSEGIYFSELYRLPRCSPAFYFPSELRSFSGNTVPIGKFHGAFLFRRNFSRHRQI